MDVLPEQLNTDKSILIEHSLNAVKKLLSEFQEFAPYALCIALQGEIMPIKIETDSEKPVTKELLAKYEELLDAKLKNQEIRSYAIAYNMVVSTNNSGAVENTNAIAIKIKQTDLVKCNYYFYAYSFSPDKELLMGHSWGVNL